MKKILFCLCAILATPLVQAEEMTFVTTMSAPIGTFARLDTANPAAKTKTPIVNFCNTRVSTGEITLRGAGAYLQKVNLTRNTTLGGDVPEYRITDDGTLRMGPGGTLTGGSLLADKISLTNAATYKGNVEGTLYASTASTTGARTDNMTIASTARISKGGPQDTLEWSNEYSADYKADGTVAGGSYSSYLLKSKGSGTPTEPITPCQPTKGQSYTERCQDSKGKWGTKTFTWFAKTCSYMESICQTSRLKRCLSKVMYCGNEDLATGAINDGGSVPRWSCQRVKEGSAAAWSYCMMANSGMYDNQELFKKYKLISSTGCTPGTECNTCKSGQRYVEQYYATCASCTDGTHAYGPGSIRTLYAVPYALCGDFADCSEGTEKSSCSWKDGNNNDNPMPFL